MQVQGTINGWGERCGNANLISIIPALQLKMARRCVPDESLAKLTDLSRSVSEIANIRPRAHAPYVGRSAFAHKGGMHVAAVEKVTHSYEQIGHGSDRLVVPVANRPADRLAQVEHLPPTDRVAGERTPTPR